MRPLAYVAEDEPDYKAMTVRALEALGFDVKTGSTGWEALRALCDPENPGGGFSLAVLDNGLGLGPQGVDVLIGLRDAGSGIPVVIHSGGIFNRYLRRVTRKKRAEFCSKPATADDLAAAIVKAGCKLPEVVA